MAIEHFDIKGRALKVGHQVAFGLPGCHQMALGMVTKINPKTITVTRKELNYRREVEDVTYVRHPEFCCRPGEVSDDE